MSDTIPQWGWVALAWAQLILSYIGYLWYLQRRERHIREQHIHDKHAHPHGDTTA